ncbi:hypothetical protein GCM10020331_042800 [Ectobacillus funiculus]
MQKFLREEYPTAYAVAWKLVRVMEQQLQLSVYEAETVYLTMHLQRLAQGKKRRTRVGCLKKYKKNKKNKKKY